VGQSISDNSCSSNWLSERLPGLILPVSMLFVVRKWPGESGADILRAKVRLKPPTSGTQTIKASKGRSFQAAELGFFEACLDIFGWKD